MIEPSLVSEGDNYVVTCNADIAGVPNNIEGIEYISIRWTDGTRPFEDFASYLTFKEVVYLVSE